MELICCAGLPSLILGIIVASSKCRCSDGVLVDLSGLYTKGPIKTSAVACELGASARCEL